MVGLDGGRVRDRPRREGRHFEVIASKVIDAHGAQHRFAFVRDGRAASTAATRQALAAAGVSADTPATVPCDGDAGLWRRQRAVPPGATPVLDWWHAAVRSGHALRAARGLGANTADADLAHDVMRGLERAKWRLRHGRWPGRRRKPAARRGRHGRWPGCRRKPAARRRWTERETLREVAGRDRVRRRVADLPGYLERDEAARVRHVARRRRGEPIPTAVVASAVDEITAWRMDKARQMRRSGTTVQPFLDARAAVPNGTLEGAFRRRRPGFRPADDDRRAAAAAAA